MVKEYINVLAFTTGINMYRNHPVKTAPVLVIKFVNCFGALPQPLNLVNRNSKFRVAYFIFVGFQKLHIPYAVIRVDSYKMNSSPIFNKVSSEAQYHIVGIFIFA